MIARASKEKEQALVDTQQAIKDHEKELKKLLEAHRIKLENLKLVVEQSEVTINREVLQDLD